jgi:orotate phosphoribosyltransferase
MAEGFLETVSTRRGHFAFESGYHSDVWMDLETLCLRPAALHPFVADLAGRLRRFDVDAVCGPLNEGAFVAILIASEIGCTFTYAERIVDPGKTGLFPVQYTLPAPLRGIVRGRRVAVVNDVISSGSAVRGAYADLESLGAEVVAIGALLVLGPTIAGFARDRGVPVVALAERPINVWEPAACPLCQAGEPLQR